MDKVDTVTTSRNCFGKLPTFVSLRLLCSLLLPLFHPPASPFPSLSICIIRYTSGASSFVHFNIDFRRLRCFTRQNELAFLRIFAHVYSMVIDRRWKSRDTSGCNGSCRGWKNRRISSCGNNFFFCCWYYRRSNFGLICSNWKHVFFPLDDFTEHRVWGSAKFSVYRFLDCLENYF